MKCSKCNKNEATVFYREIINGKETNYALCKDCAAEKESEINMDFFENFYSPFESAVFKNFFTPAIGTVKKEEKKCSLCGKTFKELCEMGKVGCTECYNSFKEELAPTLKRLHGKVSHRGRVPKKLSAKFAREKELSDLESQLKVAISEERYEEAATLRDKIRNLKGA